MKEPIEVYLINFLLSNEEIGPGYDRFMRMRVLRYKRESSLEKVLIGRIADMIIVRGTIESSRLMTILGLIVKPRDGVVIFDVPETREVIKNDPIFRPGDQRTFWIRLGRSDQEAPK